VKSFGRSWLIKASEQRTRGSQAMSYGDIDFLLMPALFGQAILRAFPTWTSLRAMSGR
jgi:hypothetical protein